MYPSKYLEVQKILGHNAKCLFVSSKDFLTLQQQDETYM